VSRNDSRVGHHGMLVQLLFDTCWIHAPHPGEIEIYGIFIVVKDKDDRWEFDGTYR
jgi:hypothetical protein